MGELAVIVEAMPERFRLMVLLATWCVLRYGEPAELQRKDTDVAHAVIKARRAVSFVPGGTMVAPPKTTAGIRDVAVPPHLLDVVRHHLQELTKPGRVSLLFAATWAGTPTSRCSSSTGTPPGRRPDDPNCAFTIAAKPAPHPPPRPGRDIRA